MFRQSRRKPGMLVQSSRAVVGFGEGQGLALMPSDSSAGATQYSSEVWRQETQAVAISCPDARGKETIRAGSCRSVSWLIGWWCISNLEHVSWANNVAGCSRRLTSCSDYSPMYHSNESKLCLLRVSADGQLQVMSSAWQSIFQHTR